MYLCSIDSINTFENRPVFPELRDVGRAGVRSNRVSDEGEIAQIYADNMMQPLALDPCS